ncbi:MAG: transglutaminase domain-containing protein [Ruminococcaceae bacterium]|nr:transglutaminase domain-containing protein [Oscillospiraceae bacterium]
MKKAIAIVLSLILCVFLSGCSPFISVVDMIYGDRALEKAESIPRVAFSKGVLFKDSKEAFFPVEDFSEVTSPYAKYRSSLYHSTLSAEEQNVYHALEYAMENCYTNILVDSDLLKDTKALEKVLKYFALDSPLLEQNLRYTVGECTASYPVEILGMYTKYASFDGYYITVENFDSEIWSTKLKALKKAQDTVADLSAELSDFEKAEKLYLKLANGITYYSYDDGDEVYPYLYDAIITGKTHCDGHANALSLLLRLAGIEVVEKMYTTQKKNEVGHTWVAFCIDGKWYNADSTSRELIPKKKTSMHSGFFFAFSDEMRVYNEDYDEVTPVCSQSKYMNPDATISDLKSNAFSNSVISAFSKRDPDWAFIIVKKENQALLKKQLQRCADRSKSTVYWTTQPLANGATGVLVCGKKLF